MGTTDNRYSIVNAVPADLSFIYWLFENAISFMKESGFAGWTNYDKDFIKKDIAAKRTFKLVAGNEIVCIFSLCYSDPLIWREKEKGDAVYLHRIVVNRKFAGRSSFQKILDWALAHANAAGLRYIRMDTWAENPKIIAYYKSHGFSFVENYRTPATPDLPVQHRNLSVALLERVVQVEA